MQPRATVRTKHTREVVAPSHLGPAVIELSKFRTASAERDRRPPQATAGSVILVYDHVDIGGRVMAKVLPSWVCVYLCSWGTLGLLQRATAIDGCRKG